MRPEQVISIRVDGDVLRRVDTIVATGFFYNRSEAYQLAVKMVLEVLEHQQLKIV